MKPIDILKLHNLTENAAITKDDFLRICPSLLHQIDTKACLHEHVKILGHFHDNNGLPTAYESEYICHKIFTQYLFKQYCLFYSFFGYYYFNIMKYKFFSIKKLIL